MEINRGKLIILLDLIHLTLGNDGVCEDFILVICHEDFIVTYEFQIVILDIKLLNVDVCLLVVPLHHDHWPLRILRTSTFGEDLTDPADD